MGILAAKTKEVNKIFHKIISMIHITKGKNTLTTQIFVMILYL